MPGAAARSQRSCSSWHAHGAARILGSKLGLTIAALTFASAALAGDGPGDRPNHDPGHTITVAGKTVQLKLVDAGEPGFTLGDQIALSDDLRAANEPVPATSRSRSRFTGDSGSLAEPREIVLP